MRREQEVDWFGGQDVMDVLPVLIAGFGLGLAIYAATESGGIARRAGIGCLGLGLFIWVVMST